MDQLPAVLQRLAAINELMTYALIGLGVLTFVGVLSAVLGVYRATVNHRQTVELINANHRETVELMNRLGYYLFKKLGPVELP
jgi:hypothetical protein